MGQVPPKGPLSPGMGCNLWGATHGGGNVEKGDGYGAQPLGCNLCGATRGGGNVEKAAVMGRSLRNPMVDEVCNRGGNADLDMMEVLVALATRPLDAGLLKSRRREHLPLLASHELMQPL